ncbi:MAG: 2,3-diketo-5-methylthiopentyl-1-phosphate enolase [Aquificae bacterium]|nr:2,3-diketo-5-methylthiopentyl-1-phosphate enolase [Aquificota bacterium]
MNYIEVTYLLTTKEEINPEEKAKEIAISLSIGGTGDLPPEKIKELEKYEGKVLDVFSYKEGKRFKTLIKIGFPVILFEHTIPSILSIIYGKISFTEDIKVVDIDFHPAFLDHFKGPRYGINGIREIVGIHHEPLLMTVLKPCVGLTTEEFANEFYKHAVGEADIVKDDEIFFDDSLAPFEKRIEACVKKAEEAEKITGRKTLYIPHLTGRVDELIQKAKRGVEAGAKGFLINALPYGFDILQRLSEEVDAFFIAHPSFSGTIFKTNHLGIRTPVFFGKLMRLAGADIVMYPSPYGKSPIEHTDALETAENLRKDLEHINPSFPAPVGRISPLNIHTAFKDFGNQTVFGICGSIYKHPDGVSAGIEAVRIALDCSLTGVSLEECAVANPELQKALKVLNKEKNI